MMLRKYEFLKVHTGRTENLSHKNKLDEKKFTYIYIIQYPKRVHLALGYHLTREFRIMGRSKKVLNENTGN